MHSRVVIRTFAFTTRIRACFRLWLWLRIVIRLGLLLVGCNDRAHSRRTGFRRSEMIINRIIIFTVNTGLLTGLFAIASLITVSRSS